MSRRSRTVLLYVLPFVLGVLWLLGPTITGSESLFLRDVFNAHLEMKWFQAEAMRSGTLPLIDPYRSGGQPHLGNLNAVPLYPDNLLYLVASPTWALNAHFWLHLLLAPLAFFYMARKWGLGREAAWASGVIYATSGYFLSAMNMYNLTAGATLAPAFIGACMSVAGSAASRWSWMGAGLLWTLLILGGDPMTAVVALGAALAAVLIGHGWRQANWKNLTWVVALGSLVAAPQVVEFLRISPSSFRGVWGYTVEAASTASWSPANVLEWFIPLAFGEPNLRYWGNEFHAGGMLFYSFYPGVVALAAMAAGVAIRDRRSRWIWVLIGGGIFLSLGSYNPVATWLMGLPGMKILRFPSKYWVLVAVGASLLAGVGLERIAANGSLQRARRALLALAVLMLSGTVVLKLAGSSATSFVDGLMPQPSAPGFAAEEVVRWTMLCGVSALLLVVAYALSSAPRLSRSTLIGALLTLHVVGQVWFLGPLLQTDSVAAYDRRSELLTLIPKEARVMHGDSGDMFGTSLVFVKDFPDEGLQWVQRDIHAQLYPSSGIRTGRRYEFWLSPEGLDSFLVRMMREAMPLVDDAGRLALLEAAGVTHLLLGRELEGIEAGRVELIGTEEHVSGPLYLYRLLESAAEVQWADRVLRAGDARTAVGLLIDPTFDARTGVVLVGEGDPQFGSGGHVEVVRSDHESLELRVRSGGTGRVVVQRSYLPIWSAEVDGQPVEIQVANIARMAVEVPAGEHDVRLWVDRRSLAPALLVSLLSLALLVLKARKVRPVLAPASD